MRMRNRRGIGSISDLIIGFVLFSAFLAGMSALLIQAAAPAGLTPPSLSQYDRTGAIGTVVNQTSTAVFSSDISITDRLFAVATAAWNAIKIPGAIVNITDSTAGQAQSDFSGAIPNTAIVAISIIVTATIMLSIMAAVFRVGRI